MLNTLHRFFFPLNFLQQTKACIITSATERYYQSQLTGRVTNLPFPPGKDDAAQHASGIWGWEEGIVRTRKELKSCRARQTLALNWLIHFQSCCPWENIWCDKF